MAKCLLFELFGPLVAWGDIAVGEQRPVQPHPTKSGVLGIVAAALGYGRDDDDAHDDLFNRLHFGVRVDGAGSLLVDYHTAQTVSAPTLKKARRARPIVTRADILYRAGELHTILSTRDYYVDSIATAALLETQPGRVSIDRIAEALDRPHYAPYLGRRCATPSLPFSPRITEADSLLSALRTTQPTDAYASVLVHLSRRSPVRHRTFLWEGSAEAGGATTIVRRDGLLSRARRQFTERLMYRLDEEVTGVPLPDRT